MKPLNNNDETCNPISSNCVIWQGPDIACIKLCRGDSVSDVVYKLATELCDVLTQLDVTGYDLSCLNLTACVPGNFKDFIQLLINTICAIQNGTSPTPTPGATCPDCLMIVAPCFQYTNPQGDLVTSMQLTDYITAIGNRICNNGLLTSTNTNSIANHEVRITTLETAPPPTIPPSFITPVCVLPSVPTDLPLVVQALETQFCALIGATGQPNDIYQAIQKQCIGLSAAQTLGGTGATMGSLPGWSNLINNFAAAFGNMWITICDIRAAIENIQANCCPIGCSGIFMNLQATMTSSTVTLFVTGTIPAGFANCIPAGSLVTISDDNGGSFTTYEDLVTFINNPSGYNISLTGTPINVSSNLHIKIDACLTNPGTQATCESILQYDIINQLNCPAMLYTPGTTTIAYTGTSLPGTNTYTVQVWDNAGTTLIDSQTQVITSPAPISGTFSGLTINSIFKVRVVIVNTFGASTYCPFASVALDPTVELPVELGGSTSFSVLAGAGITSATPSSFIGDVGSSPTVTITGIVAPDVTGTLFTSANPIVSNAKVALINAIADASSRTPLVTVPTALAGSFTPGYYNSLSGTFTLAGNVTFDAGGNPDAVFILKTTTTLITAAASTVTLINGARFSNVFWDIGSSATLGTNSFFKGNILASTSITANTGANIQGRLLANTGAVTLDANTVSNT